MINTIFHNADQPFTGNHQRVNNVLLIDDSNSTNLLHHAMLQELVPDIHINAFTSADDALAHLQQRPKDKPDIIFLDLVMPEKNGFQFMDEFLKRHENFTHQNSPLLVLVSEHLNLENFNLSKGYRMLGLTVDHVNKPLTRLDIEDLIAEHF